MRAATILGHNPKFFLSVRQHKKLSNNFVGKSNNRKNRKKREKEPTLYSSPVLKSSKSRPIWRPIKL